MSIDDNCFVFTTATQVAFTLFWNINVFQSIAALLVTEAKTKIINWNQTFCVQNGVCIKARAASTEIKKSKNESSVKNKVGLESSPDMNWSTNDNSFLFNFSQAQIILALKKKKECNTRAQEIVEELLDPVPADKVPAFFAKVWTSFHIRFQTIINCTTFNSSPTSINRILTTSSRKEPLWSCAAIHCATLNWSMCPRNNTKYRRRRTKSTTSLNERISAAPNATNRPNI